MKTLSKILIFLFVFSFQLSKSQTSILQDKSGEASILISNRNSISINAADANITFGMSFAKPKWFIGGATKFKSIDGTSNLLEGYKFNPDVSFSLYGGKILKTADSSKSHFIFGNLKLTNTNFNLLIQDNTNTFNSKNFTGLVATLGYNVLTSINSTPLIYGTSFSFGEVNNIEDLKPVTTFETVQFTSGTDTTTLQKNKKQGFEGDYLSYTALKFNFDAYFFPQKIGGQIGLGGYVRSQLTGQSKKNNFGLGIIVGKKGAPDNIVFGLLYQFNDVFNQLEDDNNFIERGGINLVAGYSF
ncbi:hypothetical protein [Flavobacterium sp.]|uniref:hypothetical protein n=1 Tax=Flavobacterium sp. TaxID=239 RepID=UPI0026176AE0|nr:hypothetical protein [Flavobacterium sp.]